jgi:cation diffusion facilitator family transporter
MGTGPQIMMQDRSMQSLIVRQFVRLFRLDQGDIKKRYGFFEGIFSVVVNLLLFAFKLILGIMVRSVALLADAVHSLSDVVTSVLVILGVRLASKPPDKRHPFGHGRADLVTSIVISCLLLVVAWEFFLSGFNRLRAPIPIHTNWLIISFLVVSILAKEFLYQLSAGLGKAVRSPTLIADAWHHRSDAISTVLVLIGFVSFLYGAYWLDGIMGMGVAVLIGLTGISMIRRSASALLGEAPSPFFLQKIKDITLNCNGVTDVHHIHVHDYGGQTEITVHIRLRSDMHIDAAHEKATEVEQCIKDSIQGAEVTIHVEPQAASQE